MAMLAEPKRKLKYSVDPRGLAWSTDSSKIGQKLIEKMGWSSGKGLGKHEDGRVEHVKVQQRFSNRGLGCTRQMADHWTAHGDDFASLLENLNAEHSGTSTPQEEEPQQPAVMSLEEKSKSCRSRVHYHRFTRGKDLSACNETDLKSIFGAKKVGRSEKCNASSSTTNSTAETSEGQPEVTFGVPIIMSTSTMAEYFAQKMAARKLNSAAAADVTTTAAVTNDDSTVAVEETAVAAADEVQEIDASICKKKKKSKKSRHAEENEDNIGSVEENGHSNLNADVATVYSDAIEIADESGATKKSKKKRRSEKTQVAEETDDVAQEECEEPVAELPLKKRRKVQQDDSEQSDSVDTSKKKSKCKTVATDVNESNADDADSNDNTTSKELGFTGSNLGKIKGYGSKKAKH